MNKVKNIFDNFSFKQGQIILKCININNFIGSNGYIVFYVDNEEYRKCDKNIILDIEQINGVMFLTAYFSVEQKLIMLYNDNPNRTSKEITEQFSNSTYISTLFEKFLVTKEVQLKQEEI